MHTHEHRFIWTTVTHCHTQTGMHECLWRDLLMLFLIFFQEGKLWMTRTSCTTIYSYRHNKRTAHQHVGRLRVPCNDTAWAPLGTKHLGLSGPWSRERWERLRIISERPFGTVERSWRRWCRPRAVGFQAAAESSDVASWTTINERRYTHRRSNRTLSRNNTALKPGAQCQRGRPWWIFIQIKDT